MGTLDNYKPVLWEPQLIKALEKTLSYKLLTNNSLTVLKGDTVHVSSLGAVSVGDYTDAAGVTYQDVADASQAFKIDQFKYFALQFKDIDMMQSISQAAVRAHYMENGAYQINDTIDQFLAAKYTDAGIKEGTGQRALGTAASPLEITADGGGSSIKASLWISRLNRLLSESNIPTNNRVVIVPPWLYQKFIIEKLTGFNDVNNTSTYKNGQVSQIAGLKFVESNNVNNNGTNYNIMGGLPTAMPFYMQFKTMESLRDIDKFTTKVKALVAYGAKVTEPAKLFNSVVTEGAEGQ